MISDKLFETVAKVGGVKIYKNFMYKIRTRDGMWNDSFYELYTIEGKPIPLKEPTYYIDNLFDTKKPKQFYKEKLSYALESGIINNETFNEIVDVLTSKK